LPFDYSLKIKDFQPVIRVIVSNFYTSFFDDLKARKKTIFQGAVILIGNTFYKGNHYGSVRIARMFLKKLYLI